MKNPETHNDVVRPFGLFREIGSAQDEKLPIHEKVLHAGICGSMKHGKEGGGQQQSMMIVSFLVFAEIK
jgi:hypothetical protein